MRHIGPRRHGTRSVRSAAAATEGADGAGYYGPEKARRRRVSLSQQNSKPEETCRHRVRRRAAASARLCQRITAVAEPAENAAGTRLERHGGGCAEWAWGRAEPRGARAGTGQAWAVLGGYAVADACTGPVYRYTASATVQAPARTAGAQQPRGCGTPGRQRQAGACEDGPACGAAPHMWHGGGAHRVGRLGEGRVGGGPGGPSRGWRHMRVMCSESPASMGEHGVTRTCGLCLDCASTA
jgi:hypothetical protein